MSMQGAFPPLYVFISEEDFVLKQITFNWSQVLTHCSTSEARYVINATNCGSCPTNSSDTTATCTDIPTDGSKCSFAVQAVVCGYSDSKYYSINVRLPHISTTGVPTISTST